MARLEEENRDFLAALEDAMEQYKLQVGLPLPPGVQVSRFPKWEETSRGGWVGGFWRAEMGAGTNEQKCAGGCAGGMGGVQQDGALEPDGPFLSSQGQRCPWRPLVAVIGMDVEERQGGVRA